MSSIPQRLYNEVMMLDNFTCVYCGKRTPEVWIDHIIPRQYGGPEVIHNLVACCPSCNAKKRDYQLHEVGMRLRFGRFTRPTHQAARRFVSTSPSEYNPTREALIRPRVSKEEWRARISQLANERNGDGTYSHSANRIRDIAGGSDAAVKDLVRAIRRPKG